MFTSFWQAIDRENYQEFKKLISEYSEDKIKTLGQSEDLRINPKRAKGLFYMACECSFPKIIELLINNPLIDVNESLKFVKILTTNTGIDINKFSALYSACKYGNLEIVKYLIEDCKADANKGRNVDGSTPFIGACKHGQYDIVEYLLKNPNVKINQANQPNNNKTPVTPLMAACIRDQHHIVKYLMSEPRIILSKYLLLFFLPSLINDNKLATAKIFMQGLRMRGIFKEKIQLIKNLYENNEHKILPYELTNTLWKSACILAGCDNDDGLNSPITQSVLELKALFQENDIAMVFIMTVLLCDGYVRLKSDNNHQKGDPDPSTENPIRFFKIMSVLPIELQMLISHRLFGSEKNSVLAKNAATSAKLALTDPNFFSQALKP